ncbi:glycoside hydrolase family 127 protein [Paenibacillus psychroresistens]|uniref:Glycoside hydrolase family 127 protein n=1 Tax=Paenibacillus psychroresistens TaxID=1778678 RepID=A0A6B8RJ85_9BACL|nr:beta-L-arabinofuranosidase domain-containing protein [Paenibacillus psychroresistens]QGQ95917.1 glycoside hydrolase family 127 protein [Paenibacillus psychroresistens]
MFTQSKAVPLKQVSINNHFWSHYTKLVREVVIPYQWEALNDRISDAEPSYAIQNFRIAAGLAQGEFGGMVFQDSDIAKWLEAVGYSLALTPDPHLEQLADEVIDIIALAQQPDGYLNTYFTLKEPGKRWTNLFDCHELYCAGHMIEAAVAYYQATGKRKLLDVMCRYADLIDSVFGLEAGKIKAYDGHQEIELALIKLYHVTGAAKYLNLSKYFIDERGVAPSYLLQEFEKRGRITHWQPGIVVSTPNLIYTQSHLPVREQKDAVGHAVRAVYMYSAMADLAILTEDQELKESCLRLWKSMVHKQMYITGGIGTTHHGEAFTFDYDLPNDTIYAETCASIGLIFFAQRMLQLEVKSEYADVMERALYNNVIGSMSLDGKHYFYVNPLEVWPQASESNPSRHHVKAVRQKWFGCSCCPPNVARLIASLAEYIYSSNEDTIYTHLYIGGEATIELKNNQIQLQQESNYPWDGSIKFIVSPQNSQNFTLAFRIPGWSDRIKLHVNGELIENLKIVNGYVLINRIWNDGDTVLLDLPMTVQLIQANPSVRSNAGKAAIQRGPLVYCLEEIDNGQQLASISLATNSKLTAAFDANLLGGIVVIEADASVEAAEDWSEELYRPLKKNVAPLRIKAIPYYLWGNRAEPGEMSVWIRTV